MAPEAITGHVMGEELPVYFFTMRSVSEEGASPWKFLRGVCLGVGFEHAHEHALSVSVANTLYRAKRGEFSANTVTVHYKETLSGWIVNDSSPLGHKRRLQY